MPDRPVVLVTGASKGIGAATAERFAAAGWDVGVNYRSDRHGAEAVAQRCRKKGGSAIVIAADVADSEAVAAMFTFLDAKLGRVQAVINNAGVIGGAARISTVTPETLRAVFAVNVFGAINCIQQAIPRMSTGQGGSGGSIVNISSVAATQGSPGEYVHYAASKGALETLTIGSAKELGPEGIRVTAIRVGTTSTDLHAREGNPDRPAAVAAATPLGRVATTDDIAAMALYLASNDASFVSGTVVTVAGGIAS